MDLTLSFWCYLHGNLFTLVTNHQTLKFLMESNRFIGKLARWALILPKYDFNVVHKASRVNRDAHGLNRNPSSSEEDTIDTMWHGEVDLEVVLRRYASAYLCTLLGCFGGVLQGNMGSENFHSDDDELKGNGALDIHIDLHVMAYLHAREVLVGLTPKERDWVVHMVN